MRIAVVHETPGRCRLRIEALREDAALRERLECALATSPVVRSHRISAACSSVTVFHGATVHDVMHLARAAVSGTATPVAAVREPLPSLVFAERREARTPAERRRARHAQLTPSRGLVVCAAIGLTLALLPQPASPGWMLAELAVSAVLTLVEYKLTTSARTPPLARILGVTAMLISLVRAGNLLRALAVHALKWLAESLIRPFLQAALLEAV